MIQQHPDITVSRPRVTDFFTTNFDKGLDWYRARFEGPAETIFLDATRSYSAAPLNGGEPNSPRRGVPARIHSVNPNARFIYVLRDPVTRTYSSYWQWRREGSERRTFREAILANPIYFDRSDYLGQIRNYLEYFPIESFLFVIFEDLARDPAGAARQCVRFLGAKPDDHPLTYTSAKNQGFRFNATGEALGRLFSSGRGYQKFLQTAKRCVPPPLRPFAMRAITSDMPAISPDDRLLVIDHFRAKNRVLRELTGLPLDHWQS